MILPLPAGGRLAVLSELNSQRKGRACLERQTLLLPTQADLVGWRGTATPPRSLLSLGAEALRFHKGIYRADWRLWGWNQLRTKWRAWRGTGTLLRFSFLRAGDCLPGMKMSSHWKGMFGKEMTSGGTAQLLPRESVWLITDQNHQPGQIVLGSTWEGAGITRALWCLNQLLPSKDSCPLF